jgi:pyrimidine operon attenuation protein / uracil phosphoribosyltransferase
VHVRPYLHTLGHAAMSASTTEARVLLDQDHLQRTLRRIAHEILEKHADLDQLALVGIYTRGVVLAQRLREVIEQLSELRVPTGALDISFYRDDVGLQRAHPQPVVKATKLDFPIDGRSVVLVDDVLYTGRTIRAAIDALFDYGRPQRVQLAVLVDRGHRELPIRPDYVGKNLPTARSERVNVNLVEIDGADRVVLLTGEEE